MRTVPAGETAMQALDAVAEDLDALRRPVRAVDRRRLRLGRLAPRLVLLRQRDRGRPRRGRVPCSIPATSSGGTTATGGASAKRYPSSSVRSRSRSCTATAGRCGPRSSSAPTSAGARALAKLVHGTRRGDARLRARTCSGSSAARTLHGAELAGGAIELDYSGDAARSRATRRCTATGTRSREADRRSALLAGAGGRGAARRPALVGRRADRSVLLLVCLRAGARAQPYLWGTLFERRLRVPALAAAPVDGLARALERAGHSGARPARRDDGGAARSRR